MTSMTEIPEFTFRDLDQEIDTIEIIPEHPDFIIVGTYHLHKKENVDGNETGENTESALRIGSLQILPFNHSNDPAFPTDCIRLIRKDFQCAIVDIKFHPQHVACLGAATSTGEIRFFNIIRENNDEGEAGSFHIIELGIVAMYDPAEYDSLPLITQFTWLPSRRANSDLDSIQLSLATCDSFGSSKIIRVDVPNISKSSDPRLKDSSWPPTIPHEVIDIHKQSHGLEAWTISTITLPQTDPDFKPVVVLSGGDDNNLIASEIEIPIGLTSSLDETPPPTHLFTNKKSHEAGVVSILPLLPTTTPPSNTEPTIPILTGSYDESIRLFHFNPTTKTHTLTSSFPLHGGVWRIALLDTYSTSTPSSPHPTKHYILLISLMYTGAMILRLTETSTSYNTPSERKYEWTIEATFKAGHTSMVYACVARSDGLDGNGAGKWNVVSTSFYDRRICNWGWVDEVKRRELSD